MLSFSKKYCFEFILVQMNQTILLSLFRSNKPNESTDKCKTDFCVCGSLGRYM